MMRMFQVVVAMVSFVFASQLAWAGATDAKERAARKACLTGDFAKGVEILADLFLKTNDFVYIFNQGRCFEQNHRYEDAIARFREFLVKDSAASKEERADAEKHIAACESYLAKAQPEKVAASASATPTPPETLPVPPAVAVPIPPQPMPPVRVATAGSTNSDRGIGWRTGGVITTSMGAAALIAGVLLNLKVNSMTTDLEKPNNYNQSTNSTRETYKTMGWIAYGVGGIAIATGAALYIVGLSQGSSSGDATVSLLPTLAPGVASITMTGAF